jgi:hypothetical protein
MLFGGKISKKGRYRRGKHEKKEKRKTEKGNFMLKR